MSRRVKAMLPYQANRAETLADGEGFEPSKPLGFTH